MSLKYKIISVWGEKIFDGKHQIEGEVISPSGKWDQICILNEDKSKDMIILEGCHYEFGPVDIMITGYLREKKNKKDTGKWILIMLKVVPLQIK